MSARHRPASAAAPLAAWIARLIAERPGSASACSVAYTPTITGLRSPGLPPRISAPCPERIGPRITAAAEPLVERRVVLGVGVGARDRLDELDGLRLLVGGDAGPAVLDDVLRSGLGALAQYHDGFDVLRPPLVR